MRRTISRRRVEPRAVIGFKSSDKNFDGEGYGVVVRYSHHFICGFQESRSVFRYSEHNSTQPGCVAEPKILITYRTGNS